MTVGSDDFVSRRQVVVVEVVDACSDDDGGVIESKLRYECFFSMTSMALEGEGVGAEIGEEREAGAEEEADMRLERMMGIVVTGVTEGGGKLEGYIGLEVLLTVTTVKGPGLTSLVKGTPPIVLSCDSWSVK